MFDPKSRSLPGNAERTQIITALIEVAEEYSYRETTIEKIIDRAGLDRPAFDRHFRGRYDCFLAAWHEVSATKPSRSQHPLEV